MRGIGKTFPGVQALADVNLAVNRGEIHGVVGENGAGKSTLMKVLSGVYPYPEYSGQIVFQGQERRFKSIPDSEKLGIIIIHQELALVPLLSIAENIFLGNEPAHFGIIDWNRAFTRTREVLAKVGLDESPATRVTDLGVGKQQLVEIAKALAKEVKLLILDEPTASLNETDSDALLELLQELKSQGISCILISHKLNEVAKVADSITVLRDGSTIETLDCREAPASESRMIRAMVGREMAERFPPRIPKIGKVVFEVDDWRAHHPIHQEREVIKGVSLVVRRGEILGIAGLMGAGRTEFAMSLFGGSWGRNIRGRVRLHGREINVTSVAHAVGAGLAYVTEDRKALGLVMGEEVRRNVTLANLGAVATRGVIDNGREYAVAGEYRERMHIRCASVFQPVVNLSGGNQQKVVLSKWLFADPEVLILDEPTRGIDVGAKYEIYSLINSLADQGKCIIMISSEMPELLGMCDRIAVMNNGRFAAEFARGEATQEKIMQAIVRDQLH
jgi:putative multiple sugar transport system ATP-binding protein